MLKFSYLFKRRATWIKANQSIIWGLDNQYDCLSRIWKNCEITFKNSKKRSKNPISWLVEIPLSYIQKKLKTDINRQNCYKTLEWTFFEKAIEEKQDYAIFKLFFD